MFVLSLHGEGRQAVLGGQPGAERLVKQLLLSLRRHLRAQAAFCWDRCGDTNGS